MPNPTQPEPMDFREKLAFAVIALVVMVFVMIFVKPELTSNDGFMLLSQAIVISALIGGVIAWAYSQTKGGDAAARTMERQADALVAASDPAWSQPKGAEEGNLKEGDTVVLAKPEEEAQ